MRIRLSGFVILVVLVLAVFLNVVSKEKELEESVPRGDAARRKILQLLARKGLEKLQDDAAFRLVNVETLQEIYDKGFPRKWKPCVLPKVNNKLKAVLLGGSTSAWASSNCGDSSDAREGRFSNLFQSKLNGQSWNATITNMAQGSTTSVWSGAMMDQLVDANDDTIDLLIWEHAINDHAPSTSGSPSEMLRFWLSRVQNLYSYRHNKPPPPILIVYLWKFNIGLQDEPSILKHGLGYRGPDFVRSMQVVDHYSALGMDIQVLNVADLIDADTFMEYRKQLLDDRHHPGCTGSHLIADLLQYTFYTQIMLNGDDPSCGNSELAQPTMSQLAHSSPDDLVAIMDPRTTIGAFSQWEPTLPRSLPTLALTPSSLQKAAQYRYNIFPDAVLPGREDRKFGYRVPLCSTDRLQLELESEAWQWLLVVFAGRGIVLTVHNVVSQTLDTQPQQSSISAKLPDAVNIPRGSHNWIDLTRYESHAGQLSVCDNSTVAQRTNSRGKIQHGWIHLLVGVTALEAEEGNV